MTDLLCPCCGGSGHKDDAKPVDEAAVREAAEQLIRNRFDTYTAKNGKRISIEGDDGEKCWIVSFEDMNDLENALRALSAEPAQESHYKKALQRIVNLDESMGHDLNENHAFEAVAIASKALSAEPAQGEQWQDIATVGERERLIIIGSYNAKGNWCAEVWHTKYLRDQQAKTASGFFMNAPHLEWAPTHFMELPSAPASEASK